MVPRVDICDSLFILVELFPVPSKSIAKKFVKLFDNLQWQLF